MYYHVTVFNHREKGRAKSGGAGRGEANYGKKYRQNARKASNAPAFL